MGLIEHPTNPISERVIGAAIEVHRHLEYKGTLIAKGYVIDLLIEDSRIVEIKALKRFCRFIPPNY